jgi:hypothetical protein
MLRTLQQMQHHVKTAYGISEDSYGCVQLPLQGVLQGNGAGPAIWMLISIPLKNMLRTQRFGFKSTNILSGEEYQSACYTYVDDTDIIHIGDSNTTPQNVFDDMQDTLNHWEGGLRATGSSPNKVIGTASISDGTLSTTPGNIKRWRNSPDSYAW